MEIKNGKWRKLGKKEFPKFLVNFEKKRVELGYPTRMTVQQARTIRLLLSLEERN